MVIQPNLLVGFSRLSCLSTINIRLLILRNWKKSYWWFFNLTMKYNWLYWLYSKSIFETVLDRHAPFKYKWVRGNEKPFMNEELRKAIMKHSRLRNVYPNSRKNSDQHAYRKQRNFVTNLLRKTRKSYFESAVNNTSHIVMSHFLCNQR